MPTESVHSNNYTTSEPDVLPSRIRRALNDFTGQVELKAARVAAGMQPADELEQVFQTVLETARESNPQRAEILTRKMAAPATSYRSEQRFQAFAEADLNKAGAVDKVNVGALHRAQVEPLARTWVNIPPIVDGLVNPDALADRLVPQAGYTGLKFHVSKVKCVEETSGFGSDEIYAGVNCIDETGDASYYWFRVSNDFDEGEVVDYGFPGKEVQHFNLTEGGNKFPKIYTVVVAMVEEDWGNMSGWFKELFEQIKQKVKDFLKAAGVALGQLIGLGELGGLIGSIAFAIFNWFISWIVSLFENDHMGSFITKSVINSYTGNWVATGTKYRSWSKKFKAHGGDYHLWYTWELAA